MANPLRTLDERTREVAERALASWIATTPRSGSLAALGLGVGLAALGGLATSDRAIAIGHAAASGAHGASVWETSTLAALALASAEVPVVCWLDGTIDDQEFAVTRELVRHRARAIALTDSPARAALVRAAGWHRDELRGDDLVAGISLGRDLARREGPAAVIVHAPEHTVEAPEELLRRRARRALRDAQPLEVVAFEPPITAGTALEAVDDRGPDAPMRALLGGAGIVRITRTGLARDLEVRLRAPVIGVPDPEGLAREVASAGARAVILDVDGDTLIAASPAPTLELAPIRTEDAALALGALVAGAGVRVAVSTVGRIAGAGERVVHHLAADPSFVMVTWAAGALATAQARALVAGERRTPSVVELVQTDPIPAVLGELLAPAERIVVVGPAASGVGQRLASWLFARDLHRRTQWYEPTIPASVLGFAARTLASS